MWEVPFEEISELKWLGSGAQGAVFLGKYHSEELAIKKVREQKETDIKHLRKLKHPNIIGFKWVHLTTPFSHTSTHTHAPPVDISYHIKRVFLFWSCCYSDMVDSYC